jgi:hypothetical protein
LNWFEAEGRFHVIVGQRYFHAPTLSLALGMLWQELDKEAAASWKRPPLTPSPDQPPAEGPVAAPAPALLSGRVEASAKSKASTVALGSAMSTTAVASEISGCV